MVKTMLVHLQKVSQLIFYFILQAKQKWDRIFIMQNQHILYININIFLSDFKQNSYYNNSITNVCRLIKTKRGSKDNETQF